MLILIFVYDMMIAVAVGGHYLASSPGADDIRQRDCDWEDYPPTSAAASPSTSIGGSSTGGPSTGSVLKKKKGSTAVQFDEWGDVSDTDRLHEIHDFRPPKKTTYEVSASAPRHDNTPDAIFSGTVAKP